MHIQLTLSAVCDLGINKNSNNNNYYRDLHGYWMMLSYANPQQLQRELKTIAS